MTQNWKMPQEIGYEGFVQKAVQARKARPAYAISLQKRYYAPCQRSEFFITS
ncbi:MAG: hypothetical protein WC346_16015 [Methanogenium sp.]|jgi:hypothetical protein